MEPIEGVIQQNMGPYLVLVAVVAGVAALMLRRSYLDFFPGDAKPQPPQQSSEGVTVLDTSAAVKPVDVFGLWANNRLRFATGASFTGDDAYQDYARTAAINGIEPMSANRFGTLLTARIEASEGRATKSKSNGSIVYRGVKLGGEPEDAGFST
jgi:hypothetical protein